MNRKQEIGRYGERIALEFLERHNYRIIATNVKISFKEIDIIASIGKKIIFVEVKTRLGSALGDATEAFTGKKVENMKWVISEYISNNKIDEKYVQIDLIAVDIVEVKNRASIKHYKDIY
jgi:putative endonuclease